MKAASLHMAFRVFTASHTTSSFQEVPAQCCELLPVSCAIAAVQREITLSCGSRSQCSLDNKHSKLRLQSQLSAEAQTMDCNFSRRRELTARAHEARRQPAFLKTFRPWLDADSVYSPTRVLTWAQVCMDSWFYQHSFEGLHRSYRDLHESR